MRPRAWLDYLLPREEERDPAFRQEVERLSVVGLRVIAGVCIGAPAFMISLSLFWFPLWQGETPAFLQLSTALGILTLGLVNLAASFWRRTRPYARVIGIVVGYLVFVIEISPVENVGFHVGASLSVVMLVGIAALPLKPLQPLFLGLAMIGTYAGLLMGKGEAVGYSGPFFVPPAMLLQVVLICVALTVVVYDQRVAAFRARRAAERSFEELREAQARLLMSENASSQARFAAALSHELNSPLGAMSGAIETLVAAFGRSLDEPEQKRRLRSVFEGAAGSLQSSIRRLKETVERMKHLTNLDRAEAQVVDLNELLSDTTDLLRKELERKADIVLELGPLPVVACRPQQLSAVFSNLLRNAAAAIDERGRIRVATQRRDGEVILEVEDNGRGISPERLEHLFDPTFRIEGSRIATTNWGLFTSRSIVADHGGQLEIRSTEGQGTTARIVLPAYAAVRSAPPPSRTRASG